MRYLLFFLLLFTSLGAEEDNGFVILPEQKVHEGDYFATGGSVEISGTVTGDVYAFGSRIVVDGVIEGDLIGSGGTIRIEGKILGDARLAGGQILLNGSIGRNLTAMGGNIQLSSGSVVGKNAVLTGGLVDLAGVVGGSVTLTASTGRISGVIGQNLKAYVGSMRLTSRTRIGRNLEYSSNKEARVDEGAQIGGQILYHPSIVREVFSGEWKKGIFFGSWLTPILMNFVFTFVLGLIFLKLFPRRVKAALDYLAKRPWKSFWVGLLILVLLPLTCLILFITILGFPLALGLLAISLLGFYSAKIFPILFLSNRIFPKWGTKKNKASTLLLGVIAFFLLIQIPLLGGLISLIFTLLGLGAMALGRVAKKKV